MSAAFMDFLTSKLSESLGLIGLGFGVCVFFGGLFREERGSWTLVPGIRCGTRVEGLAI